MLKRQSITKFLFPAFYSVAMMLVVFYAWNEQSSINRSGDRPLYLNLLSVK